MPTLDTSSLKRRRTEVDSAVDERELCSADSVTKTQFLGYVCIPATRSDIWFEDGSVVLQAENVQFKVHRTVLSRHSSVFLDVFTMPHPKDEPVVEGCPVIHLHDSADDVRQLLLALYDKGYKTGTAIPFKMVAAMIRMGRKYDINHLQEEGLLRLTKEFPNELDVWEKLQSKYTQIQHEECDEVGLLYDIVNLAEQNDIKSILPAAYYLCLQDIGTLLSGARRPDGSTTHVSYGVKTACILGREKLLRTQSTGTFSWVDDLGNINGCMHPNRCMCVSIHLTKALWKPMPDPEGTLDKWSVFSNVHTSVENLCSTCQKHAELVHEDGRQRTWANLPSYFGLPDWSELRDLQS